MQFYQFSCTQPSMKLWKGALHLHYLILSQITFDHKCSRLSRTMSMPDIPTYMFMLTGVCWFTTEKVASFQNQTKL